MPRFLKICGVALLGLLVMIAGFAYAALYAGVPNQDPSPAMQAEWSERSQIAGLIMMIGLFVFVMGTAAMPLIWYKLRKSRRVEDQDDA